MHHPCEAYFYFIFFKIFFNYVHPPSPRLSVIQ